MAVVTPNPMMPTGIVLMNQNTGLTYRPGIATGGAFLTANRAAPVAVVVMNPVVGLTYRFGTG